MAKPPGNEDAALSDGDTDLDSGEGEDLSLDEILTLYAQPINEEQAWAVCYQCCQFLSLFKRARRNSQSQSQSQSQPGVDAARRIEGPGDVRICKDGTVKVHPINSSGKSTHISLNTNEFL